MMVEPWYFEAAYFSELPDHVMGQDIIVNVVDSCIDFTHPSLISTHAPSKDDQTCERELEKLLKELNDYDNKSNKGGLWKEYIHGTSIAGIIASKEATYQFNKLDGSMTHYKDKGIKEITVSGLAPDCKIKGIKKPINPPNVEETIKENRDILREVNNKGTEYFPKFERSNMILVNLSGGQKGSAADKYGWNQIITQACEDKYTLIMASVGNDACNLNSQSKCGIYPAFFNAPKACKQLDPVLRVAASTEYTKQTSPGIYHSSNRGSQYVDVLAPGQSIPSLVPGGYGNNK